VKAYLDTNIVSSIRKRDNRSEAEAIATLINAGDLGQVQLVTSELTLEEIKRVPSQYRLPLEQTFHKFEKVAIVRWDELIFLRPISSAKPGPVGPVSLNEPLYDSLLNLGLEVPDARHLFVAVRQNCQAFLTCDNSRRTGILRRATKIQSLTGMVVQRPSEFLATQGW